MGRKCGLCWHSDRGAIEAELAAGTPMRDVAGRAGLSGSAIQRHASRHVSGGALHRLTGQVQVADLTDRYMALLAECSATRAWAAQVNDGSLLLRAVATEASLLNTLIQRLGISDSDTAAVLHDAKRLATAVGAAVRSVPGLSVSIAGHLREVGAYELADAVSQLPTAIQPRRPHDAV